MLRIITQAGAIVQELQRLQRRSPSVPWSLWAEVLAQLEAFTQDNLGVDKNKVIVSIGGSQLDAAYQRIAQESLRAIRRICPDLEQLYRSQLPKARVQFGEDGSVRGQRFYPLQRVGFYLDGATADRLDSLIRQGMLARTVGVKEMVLVIAGEHPGDIAPELLVAAQEMGIAEIYQAAGPLAIAVLALGTAQIRPVQSISGEGSAAVMVAKQLFSDRVLVDRTQLNQDLVILADGDAPPDAMAQALLTQARQYPQGSLVLIGDRLAMAEAVAQRLEHYCREQPATIATEKAIVNFGLAAVVDDLSLGWNWVNQWAPQRLLLAVPDPWAVVEKIQRVGEIYIGGQTPIAPSPTQQRPNPGVMWGGGPLALHCFLRPSQLFDAGTGNNI